MRAWVASPLLCAMTHAALHRTFAAAPLALDRPPTHHAVSISSPRCVPRLPPVRLRSPPPPPPPRPLRLPSTPEMLLITCKVARLPEVQQVPRSLRLRSAYSLVACAFEELPSICAASDVLYPGSDPCLQWDELIDQLTRRLDEKTEAGPLSRSQHRDLIRAVVEVIFGDSLVADFTDEIVGAMMPEESTRWEGMAGQPAAAKGAAGVGALGGLMQTKGTADGVDRREALVEKWSAQLERCPSEVGCIVDTLLLQLEGAMPWPVRTALCTKQYDEFERLHAHMRLMLAQALVLPPLRDPLTESQQDALVLDLLERVLGELNLYAHECGTLVLMAEAIAQARAPSIVTLPPDATQAAVEALRAGLQWEVELHERRLRELRVRIDALNVELRR
ncbi:hypothetical protein AB1Y20_009292 [Prymnesium parvum]|uniref:Uncharacterized protein n=1 Tax=Prymnesium parvum TaxID=97485 RepID=A0AB34K689_PRYPA